MIEQAIAKLIDAVSSVTGRVYPVVKPQDAATFPLVVYERISTERPHSQTQRSSGLGVVRIQIRTWAKTYADARTAGEAIRLAIDGYKGDVVVGSTTFEVQAILAEDERDDYDVETKLFGTLFDVRVWFTETVPT
ncbi:MAG: DUF3168 domain-containing protein [Deltaproteobacteria bacterium]|nr:MAG: DUF3168 domain-containing protein [Deltaproteobacteria bacterium]